MTATTKSTHKAAPIDFDAEIAELHTLLRPLGEEAILMRNGGKLAEKEKSYFGDIVTEADKLIEAEMVKRIAARHPDHYVYGEEGSASGPKDSPYRWIIAPIDGTKNFSKGLPLYATSIAFVDHAAPTMSILYFPELVRFVHAVKRHGIFDNGKPIATFERPVTRDMNHALIAGSASRHKNGRAEVLGELRASSLNLVNMGSTAFNCLLLAQRRIDAMVNTDAAIFNIAAAIPLLEEAGCVVSTLTNDHPDLMEGRTSFIAATNADLIKDIKTKILPVWQRIEK